MARRVTTFEFEGPEATTTLVGTGFAASRSGVMAGGAITHGVMAGHLRGMPPTGAAAPTASSAAKVRVVNSATKETGAGLPQSMTERGATERGDATDETTTTTTKAASALLRDVMNAGGSSSGSGSGLNGVMAPSELKPGDGVLMADSRSHPGAPVVFRTRAAREANPERLDLDRRELDQCVLLEGEHRLRLLNYQHNAIRTIARLESVRNLVFLDMYANRIERISGLECVPGLRVLMLGRNRITAIEGLSHLDRLDVLDLHNNEITSTAGLADLRALRILNLAGNALAAVGDLTGLTSLAELNLRRNLIAHLGDHDAILPPGLQRCFLSHNAIESPASLAGLRRATRLTELSADGNPMEKNDGDGSEESRLAYRRRVVAALPGLHTLDNAAVTAEDRRMIHVATDTTDTSAPHTGVGPGGAEGERRTGAGIAGGAAMSVPSSQGVPGVGRDVDETEAVPRESTRTGTGSTVGAERPTAAGGPGRSHSPRGTEWQAPHSVERAREGSASKEGEASRTAAAAAAALKEAAATAVAAAASPAAGIVSGRFRAMKAGYVQYDPDARRLSVFGHVEDPLDSHADAARAESVALHYVQREDHLAAVLGAVRRMPRVGELRFEAGGPASLSFVDRMAVAGFGAGSGQLVRLHVAGCNPAATLALLRPYAAHRLPSLDVINDVGVTPEERRRAAAMFAPLDDLRCGGGRGGDADPTGGRLQRAGTAGDGFTAEDERKLSGYVRLVAGHAADIVDKLRRLDEMWPELVAGYVAEGLHSAACSSPSLARGAG